MSHATIDASRRPDSIHRALAAELRQQILSGKLQLGDALESESELCRRFSVSRTPVRQALSLLASEGLIERIQGKGSFVSATVPNTFAGSRTRSGVTRLAVLVDSTSPAMSNPVALAAIESLLAVADDESVLCKMAFEFHRFAGVDDPVAQEFVSQPGVDGVVIFPFDLPSLAFLSHLKPGPLPIVSLYRYVPSAAVSQFYVDHTRGAYAATDYLIRLGHRRIAFLSAAMPPTPAGMPPNVLEQRLAGYRKAMMEAGVVPDPDLVASPAIRGSEVSAATVRLLGQDNPPTALLVGGGVITPHCMAALSDAAVRIPEDLSVLVFDQPPVQLGNQPQIGGVAMPMMSMSRMALECLFTQISNGVREVVTEAVAPHLYLYESCRPVS